MSVAVLFPREMLNNGRSVVEQLEPNDDNFGKVTERLRLLVTIPGKS